MKGFGVAAAAVAATFVSSVAAQTELDPIVIKGQYFFYKTNGTQFYIKGVAYQQDYTGGGTSSAGSNGSTNGYIDPLADTAGCQRDIPYLKQLETNTIRVYAVDPTQDHSGCMSALADADIYVIADLSDPNTAINRDDPQWDGVLYSRYTSVVDSLQNYTNVLGFFAGNEVSNAPNNTAASAFVKAAVRDTKAYIKQKNYRTIGVGYATNDDATIRVEMADYFNCGDQTDAIDFWGYNIYSWCGDSSFTESGYNVRTEEFSNYSVPAFFAEYGCNTVQPRQFTEVGTLFGPQMDTVFSGGIVYMYFEEANNFGLISLDGNTVSTLADFNSLSSQIAKVSPTGVNSASYTPSNSPQACPSDDTTSWAAAATPLPPTPNAELCSCMYDSLTCVVAPNVDESDYGTLFGQVCGYAGSPCDGITANATTGDYGAYGMCNSNQQLAFAFNQYAKSQSTATNACDFGGSATTKASSTGGSGCSALIDQAGTAGTGTVTSAPTGTGSSGSSGSSASGASAASSSGGAGINTVPGFTTGVFQLSAFAVLAGGSLAGMLLL